jgi:hypothetical protein
VVSVVVKRFQLYSCGWSVSVISGESEFYFVHMRVVNYMW